MPVHGRTEIDRGRIEVGAERYANPRNLAAGTLIVDGPDRMVWITWQGRVTAMERRARTIAIVTGAPLTRWPAALADAWRWSIAWAARP